jgi:uncharacterized protein (TIGR02118 family)
MNIQYGEGGQVAKLIILYGHPADPRAFEDYYAHQHLPYAAGHMPGVRSAENIRITATPDGAAPPYYRVSQLTYDSMADLRTGISSEDGRSVIADLGNFATGGAAILLGED